MFKSDKQRHYQCVLVHYVNNSEKNKVFGSTVNQFSAEPEFVTMRNDRSCLATQLDMRIHTARRNLQKIIKERDCELAKSDPYFGLSVNQLSAEPEIVTMRND